MSTESKFPPQKFEENIKTQISAKLENENKEIVMKHPKEPSVEFDDLLSHAGEFGKYQMILLISTCPFYFFGVFVYFSQMFMTESSSQHWCWIPELENMTTLERRTLAIPINENERYGYSRCKSYDVNWTKILESGQKPDPSWTTVPCQHGWEFDTSEFPYPTVSTDWGWVCDKSSYQASAQSIFFFGSIFGGLLFGWLSDRYGRLPVMVSSNLVGCVGGLASTFTRNFTEFALCRFIMGLSYDNCMMMTYLLVLEYIAPKYRTMFANLSFALFYAVAAVSLPWIALACGDWKTISIATSLPLALAVLSPIVFLESPRWLLTKGRVDEAINKLLVIGRVNNKEIPVKLIENFKDCFLRKPVEEQHSVLEILKRPLQRKMFVTTCVVFICCGIVFDALVRSLGTLDSDFFLSFSLVSFTEFPSLVVVAFLLDCLGRRWLTTVMMFSACLFSILTAFAGGGIAPVACAVLARFSINISYSACNQWCAEMLPTSVRGSGVAIIHICGSIATVISPYIVYLETYITWLPLVVVGCISALGGVLTIFLPETSGKDMPQTFEDCDRLLKSQSFWEIPCLTKRRNNVKAENDASNQNIA